MARYRSCKNCPAYNHRYLSQEAGKCALRHAYTEDETGVKPAEECNKPKNIPEMHYEAKRLGFELPGSGNLMSEQEYVLYLELRKICYAQRKGDSAAVADGIANISKRIHGQ